MPTLISGWTWIALSCTDALRRGCSRSARAAARTIRSVIVGTGIPACDHCSLSCARNATAASIAASVPSVSCAISCKLACIRDAMTPRIPVSGMTSAAAAAGAASPSGAVLGRCARTSERRTVPPGPVATTAPRSTPAAAASRRTSGETT